MSYPYCSFNSINRQEPYIETERKSKLHLAEVYKEMQSYYVLGDYLYLIRYIESNPYLCYMSNLFFGNNESIPYNKNFKGMINHYFDRVKYALADALKQPLEYPSQDYYEILIKSDEKWEISSTYSGFCEQISGMIKSMLDLNYFCSEDLDPSSSMVDFVNGFITNVCYKNEIDIRDSFYKGELQLVPFNILDVDLSKIVISSSAKGNIESEEEIKFRLGEKYGNQYLGIYSYCLNREQFYDNVDISSFNEDKVCFELYCINKIFSMLSNIMLTKNTMVLEDFIINGLDVIMDVPFIEYIFSTNVSDILYNSNINVLKLSEKLKAKLLYTSKCITKLSTDCIIKWCEFLRCFVKNNRTKIDLSYFFNLSDEVLCEIAKKNQKAFEFYIENCFNISTILFLRKHREIAELIDNFDTLDKVKNNIEDITSEKHTIIDFALKNIDTKKLKNLFKQLNLEQKMFVIEMPHDRISILQSLNDMQKYIIDEGFENYTTKKIIKLVNGFIDGKTKELESLKIKSYKDLILLCEDCNNLKLDYEYIKDRIFNVEYKDVIEKNKQSLAELKNEFYKKTKYDKERYYHNFRVNLLKRIEDETEKDYILKKWDEIILCFKKDEIIQHVSTFEYIYTQLINQDMEFTPLFVDLLKAIEQFLCAYIHYMQSKKLISTNHILYGEWEDESMGLFLEEYIDKNIHRRHIDKIGYDDSDEWLSASKDWRIEARNGNVHKHNVSIRSKLNKNIDHCFKLIICSIKIAKKFD